MKNLLLITKKNTPTSLNIHLVHIYCTSNEIRAYAKITLSIMVSLRLSLLRIRLDYKLMKSRIGLLLQ